MKQYFYPMIKIFKRIISNLKILKIIDSQENKNHDWIKPINSF